MNYQKACKILELESPFTKEEVKKQYHKNALRFHPDKCREKNSEKFREVQEAYEFLKEYNSSETFKTDAHEKWYKIYLSSLFSDDILQSEIVDRVVQKVSKLCVNKSLSYLKTMPTENLILLYNTIQDFKSDITTNGFNIINDIDIIDEIERILTEKLKNNNTYLIKTSLDDLFKHNVYKLQYEDKEFLIPLWHNELYYSHNKTEIIVKCIPELPEHITIDEDNNIHVSVRVSLYTLFKNPDKKLEISVGQQTFSILVEDLYIREYQIYTLKKQGIARIDTNDMYSIKKISDIHVHIKLVE